MPWTNAEVAIFKARTPLGKTCPLALAPLNPCPVPTERCLTALQIVISVDGTSSAFSRVCFANHLGAGPPTLNYPRFCPDFHGSVLVFLKNNSNGVEGIPSSPIDFRHRNKNIVLRHFSFWQFFVNILLACFLKLWTASFLIILG